MDVDSFVERNKADWKRLEGYVAHGSGGLAKLSGPEIEGVVRLYLRVSSHLAESQTRYHDQRLTHYLNQLVTRAHAAVYSGRPKSLRSGARLFGMNYRAAIRRTLPYIGVAAAVLLVVTLVVLVWAMNSREAQAGLLPPAARDAVRRAGGGGELGVPPAGLSALILLNNVQVAFLAFAFGIAFGVGTLYVLVQNAALIGALAGAYTAAGNAGTFWTLVLPHGFLEITAICIAAGAGLRMGWSLIDPGERTRSAAVVEDARDAAIVIVGVVPAFVVAAFIEGFLTPSGVPGPLKLAVGAAVAVAYAMFLAGPPARYKRPNAFNRR